jgi:hypothetical protein
MRVGAASSATQVLAFQLRRFWFHKKFCKQACDISNLWEPAKPLDVICAVQNQEADMGFGRGALLWLIGIPLPIILILALFMHH